MDGDLVVRWSVDPDEAELAADRLWQEGATAVGVEDGAPTVLTASFPTADAVRSVAATLGARVEEVPGGWRDAWKAHAGEVAVGDRLVVAPAWRPVPVGGERVVVELDPGAVFGSGTHPSTRMLLDHLAGEPPAGDRVLDVGTGSGILAVTAALLGAAEVLALDVDPDAVAVAARNAARNWVADRVRCSTVPLSEAGGGWDLALVNVTAGVHAELGPPAVATVRPGGRIAVAGLLPGQWRHVAGAYAGAEVTAELALDGWVGAILTVTG